MVRQYGYAAAGQVTSVVLAVVALAIITRTLGPENYGTYLVLMTAITLLAVAVSAGPQAAALIIAARDPGRRASLHGQILIATVVLTAITFGVAPLIAGPLSVAIAPALDPIVVIVNLIRLPAVVYASLITSQLSGAGRVGTAAALAIVSAFVGLLAPVGALVAPDPLFGAVLGTALGGLLSAVIAGGVAGQVFGLARPLGSEAWRGVADIAVPMHIGTVAYWAMLRLDVIVVSVLLGRHEAGTYGLALGISERVGLLTTPVYNATAWRISGPDRVVALRTMLQVARLELVMGTIVALGVILAGPVIVLILSGSRFAAAAIPMAILVIGAAALPVWAAVGLYLVSHLGGVWTTARLQVVVAAASVVGYATLTRLAGASGAASVSTGAYLLLLGAGLVLIKRSTPFRWRDLLPGPEFVRISEYIRTMVGRDPGQPAA